MKNKKNNQLDPLEATTAPNALTERIKELNCLYGISNLFENQDVSLSWIMKRAVNLIPAAWQYPEHACARIRIGNKKYTSKNFKETKWHQNAKIILNEKHVGDVDVFYTVLPFDVDESLFLEEESRLLEAIGERLSKVVWLKRYEEAIKESEERYRVLVEQVTEGVALVQNSRFCYVNPSFCEMFNVASADNILNKRVFALSANEMPEISKLYKSTINDEIMHKINELHLIEIVNKQFWIQVCHSPISFKSRRALLTTFKDVTEIKEQQIAAQKKAAQLDSENKALRFSLKERYRLGDILGRTPAMQKVYELILKAAATDASVAIFGESGSGKELVANAIHRHSDRKNKEFVAVNCGAIQDSLFEREFFGHQKGAFSSAYADAPGYLDMADGGTLFLDEVSELTVNMQAKLLRAIEGGGYRPLGSTDVLSSDFRIISASNEVLTEKVADGYMRNDFFYRIQVIQIQLPPLRERKQDIPLLIEHFLHKMESPKSNFNMSGRLMDILMEYNWPGNVRELRNVLQRFLALGHLEFLPPGLKSENIQDKTCLKLKDAVRDLETSMIARALKEADGNKTRAAKLLGISRRALFRKMTIED